MSKLGKWCSLEVVGVLNVDDVGLVDGRFVFSGSVRFRVLVGFGWVGFVLFLFVYLGCSGLRVECFVFRRVVKSYVGWVV